MNMLFAESLSPFVECDTTQIALNNIRQRVEIKWGGSPVLSPGDGGTVVTVTIPDNTKSRRIKANEFD